MMKSLIVALGVCALCSTAVAQNKIPSGFYKEKAFLSTSKSDLPPRAAVSEKKSRPVFLNEASALKAAVSQCAQSTPTSETDSALTLKAINNTHDMAGWRFALQDCWLFVNTLHKNPVSKSGPDYYLFDSIGQLQQAGLLPDELLSRPMPGARELIRQDEGPFFRTVSAFHASGF